MRRRPPRQTLVFQPLEPRHLLAADVEFDADASQLSEDGLTGAGPTLVVSGDDLTGTSDADRTVGFAVTGGSAIDGTDFTTTGSFVVPEADYSTTPGAFDLIGEGSIVVTDDPTVEADENLGLLITTIGSALSLGDADGDGPTRGSTDHTIEDNDTATIAINSVVFNESDGSAMFSVSLDRALDIDIVIDVDYADVTATGSSGGADADFDTDADQVTFLAGDTTDKTVTVALTDDNIVEAPEMFLASLSTATALGGRSVDLSDTGTGTVEDNDTAVFSIDDVTVDETDGTATFTVSLSNPVDIAFDVDVSYTDVTATGNVVEGNAIGHDLATGTPIFNNRGIEIKTDATGNTIGGPGEAGNVISGNTKGILLNSVKNNLVQGNKIGTNAAGDAALPNTRGVLISGGSNNQIGDEPNVISGNLREGVRIFKPGASGNVIRDNLIGTNAAGDAAIANRNGVVISPDAGSNNTIGGTTEAERNVISGNTRAGVALLADGNSVVGNFIGTDAAGTAAVGNETGVLIDRGGNDNTIGGTVDSGRGNVISGNTEEGVRITGDGTTANKVTGNAIGTDPTGMTAVGNKHGVLIESAANMVGGATADDATADDGNVISGNTQNGVYLIGAAATGNMIQTNRIGINIDGTGAVANARSGVLIENAPANTVGGAGTGNAIGGNTQQGVRIAGAGSTGNLVQGNSIGFDAVTAVVVANRDGVRVADGASGNTIGGQAGGEANEIAGNTGRGVWINDGTGNTVTRNSIHDNAALGISIGGQARTPNDVDDADADTGANNLQNFPEIASAVLDGGSLDVEYSIPTIAGNSAFPITVEFFLVDGDGEEGKTFLDQHSYAAPGTATASIDAGAAQADSVIVATATDADGNTSEFSAAATVSQTLLAADGEAVGDDVGGLALRLTHPTLEPIVDVAAERLVVAGFARDSFDYVEIAIADLPGAVLGLATGNTITIDADAAGHGWNVSGEWRVESGEHRARHGCRASTFFFWLSALNS